VSFSINASGHGAAADDVKQAFRDLIAALDAATPADQSPVYGTAGGNGPAGNSFSIDATAARADNAAAAADASAPAGADETAGD